jgi:hypothetical protein
LGETLVSDIRAKRALQRGQQPALLRLQRTFFLTLKAIAPSAAYQLDYCGGATTSFDPQPAVGKRYADGKQDQ